MNRGMVNATAPDNPPVPCPECGCVYLKSILVAHIKRVHPLYADEILLKFRKNGRLAS